MDLMGSRSKAAQSAIAIGIVLMGAAVLRDENVDRRVFDRRGVYRERHLGSVKSASCGVFA